MRFTFYDLPLGHVKEELRLCCELEPFNAMDANSIILSEVTGHLVREVLVHLTPMVVLSGFHVEG